MRTRVVLIRFYAGSQPYFHILVIMMGRICGCVPCHGRPSLPERPSLLALTLRKVHFPCKYENKVTLHSLFSPCWIHLVVLLPVCISVNFLSNHISASLSLFYEIFLKLSESTFQRLLCTVNEGAAVCCDCLIVSLQLQWQLADLTLNSTCTSAVIGSEEHEKLN